MNLVTLEDLDKWAGENPDTEAAYIKPASLYTDEVIDAFHAKPETRTDCVLPWSRVQGSFDIRPGEVTLWLGQNGSGKSLVTGQAMLGLMDQGQKVLIASMEMKPVATLKRMNRQASQGPVPTIQFIKALGQWTDERLWIYDQHGTITPERALNLIRYAVEKLDIQHIVIDSLMKIIANEDDYNGQKTFVDALCIKARDTNIHVHLIHHSRKPSEGSHRQMTRYDAKGSGAISDLVDNVVIINRVTNKEHDEDPDAFMRIDKQRHDPVGGNDDVCIPLWFHAPSMQLVGTHGLGPMRLVNVW